jgi:rhodanese-related sulfurtransferase
MTKTVFLLFAALAATAGAQQSPELASAKLRVEWSEFKKLYDQKKIVVVDVRSENVFETGHIPGALSVPLDTVEKRIDELKKLGKPIVFYCA